MKIVDGQAYLAEVKEMIRVYTQVLARDLSFQNLADELAAPQLKYCPPKGELLVAIDQGQVLGMVAFRAQSSPVPLVTAAFPSCASIYLRPLGWCWTFR